MIDKNIKEKSEQYPWERKLETIDLEKRYDMYISGPENKKTVYKNVKIKGLRGITDSSASVGNEYFLLEQDDGTEILISNFSISLICLSSTEPKFEII